MRRQGIIDFVEFKVYINIGLVIKGTFKKERVTINRQFYSKRIILHLNFDINLCAACIEYLP